MTVVALLVSSVGCLWLGLCLGVWAERSRRAMARHASRAGQAAVTTATAPPPAQGADARERDITRRVRAALGADANASGEIEIKPAVNALGNLLAHLLGHYAANVDPEQVAVSTVRTTTDEIFAEAMRLSLLARQAAAPPPGEPDDHDNDERVH